MNLIHHIISKFETMPLQGAEIIKLMDRIETKYVFNFNELDAILNELINDYIIVVVNEQQLCDYQTIYFDTDNFDLYNQHHNGKLNRYKVRYRTYVESCLNYLEVKFKNNKGRTKKTRIQIYDVQSNFSKQDLAFLDKELPFSAIDLNPKIWVNYKRITLVNIALNERITVDLNLQFSNLHKEHLCDQLVIAEVKQNKKTNSLFIDLMRKKHIHPISFSKYCFGVSQLFTQLKTNNFKQTFLRIHNIV